MSEIIWVQMTITISGGRADGRPWPDRGGAPIDLPADEALPLIRAGNAIRVDPPEAARPLPPPASMTPAPVSEPAATARGPAYPGDAPAPDDGDDSSRIGGQHAPEPEPEPRHRLQHAPEPEPGTPSLADMSPPKPADPKQAWVDYAMAHGETEDDANMQTKAELMQKYGGRL